MQKYGFLIIIVRLFKYKTIIKNQQIVWKEPEDLGLYDNSIAAINTTFAQSKKEKTHSRKKKEYEKYLGVTESMRTLILKTVNKPYLEALKKEYICYDGILLTTMIHHLWIKISKVTNRDKAAMKHEILIPWEQPMVLSTYFKKIKASKKKIEKWNVTVSDDDIVIHVMEQMYDWLVHWGTHDKMGRKGGQE